MGHFTAASLRGAAGHDMFYSIVAELDPTDTVAWFEMVSVQADFAAGEAGYDDEATRTYSESMRLTACTGHRDHPYRGIVITHGGSGAKRRWVEG